MKNDQFTAVSTKQRQVFVAKTTTIRTTTKQKQKMGKMETNNVQEPIFIFYQRVGMGNVTEYCGSFLTGLCGNWSMYVLQVENKYVDFLVIYR